MIETMDHKYGKEIDRQKKIWEKRNRVYLSMNKELTDWVTYQDIKKEELEQFHDNLNKEIEIIIRIKDNFFVYVDNPPY